MIHRPIGKTGMSASIIGLGAEFLDRKPYETVESVIHAALDRGVNIIDVFMPGEEVRQFIGRAIKGRREKIIIQGHIGATDIKQQYDISRDRKTIQKYFEDLLRHLNTDYIDFGMLFFIDTEKHFEEVFSGDVLPYALELKQKGVIRAIGASSHNPIIAKKVVESGYIDLLMFSINPAFDMLPSDAYVFDHIDKLMEGKSEKNIDPGRQGLYKFCEQKNVAITVMKTLGAAKLISPKFTPFGKPLTVNQCIHYALTRPAVVSALLGCSEVKHVEDAIAYLSASDDEKDYSQIIKNFQGSMKGSCMYCSHCQPCCMEIDIAAVMKALDLADMNAVGIDKTLKDKASLCNACGSCEERCPFGVPVRERMKKAAG